MPRQPERCYCGDPECRYCFPFSAAKPEEADYDDIRQGEVDDEAREEDRSIQGEGLDG